MRIWIGVGAVRLAPRVYYVERESRDRGGGGGNGRLVALVGLGCSTSSTLLSVDVTEAASVPGDVLPVREKR